MSSLSDLTPRQRTILEILAVAWEPITRSELADALNRTGARCRAGRFTVSVVTPTIRQLTVRDLVVTNQRTACRPAIAEQVVRGLSRARLQRLASLVRKAIPIRERTRYIWETRTVTRGAVYRCREQAERELRLALYLGEAEALAALRTEGETGRRPLASLWNALPDPAWTAALLPPHGALVLAEVCEAALETGASCTAAFAALETLASATSSAEAVQARARQHIVRGAFDVAEELLAGRTDSGGRSLSALAALARGDVETALLRWDAANTARRRETRKRIVHPPLPDALFHVAALLAEDRMQAAQTALAAIERGDRLLPTVRPRGVNELNNALLRVEDGTITRSTAGDNWENHTPLELLAASLAARWAGTPLPPARRQALERGVSACSAADYSWLAAELEAVLAPRTPARRPPALRALVVPRPLWQIKLDALTALGLPEPAPSVTGQRMAWRIGPEGEVEPRIQKVRKGGGWTGGRRVALHRLEDGDGVLSFLTAQDGRAAEALRVVLDPYSGKPTWELESAAVLAALVGHPLLFDLRGDPVELSLGEVRLSMTSDRKGLRLKLEPPLNEDGWTLAWSGSRATFYRATPKQRELGNILGGGLKAPRSAEAQLRAAAEALAPHLQVQIAGAAAAEIAAEPGDPTPWFTITPADDGLSFALRVRPLGEDGPAFPPGGGQSLLLATLAGTARRAQRDLAAETARASAALRACPALEDAMAGASERRCALPLALALPVLQQLDALGDQVCLRWSRTDPWSVTPDLGGGALSLEIKGRGGGFALSGALSLGDEELELGTLGDMLADSPSRFVQIAPGRFVALTEAFRRRLEAVLRAAPGLRLPGYAAPLLEELTEEAAQVRATRAWTAMLARIRAAAESRPEVPSLLRAELRPYQEEGFRWLARLSVWGAGACLADDMGLGKTVQALALMLHRGAGGPALVVAPTSVCGTWLAEARRFAPTLRAVRFGPGDRAETLAGLGPMSLLVCSYGLLISEREALTEIEWHTVVLDEAQAIKNPQTRRHQAAVALQAEFRMVTTGTPIENHLGELWSLMRFLNPGLLGTHRRFRETWADPIERDSDPRARAALRRLLRPFMLRRRKSQVLHELPPRTDVALSVVLPADEAAHYEALRQTALARAREGGTMQMLAEITRLRRACCHPRLIDPQTTLPGAKLAAFRELVGQLREGGHKALVFSQFVAHLTILREWLDAEEIPYQYLDGSTPTRARERAVRAFQSGQGDLFLISLRAGGFGLNLTAADYVLHMDPWWNPAVEDQASDRAHRIGQTRPVTVYRLVTQGTIEERVLQLHAQKRALAQRVLEGAEQAARITADEWLSLLETPAD